MQRKELRLELCESDAQFFNFLFEIMALSPGKVGDFQRLLGVVSDILKMSEHTLRVLIAFPVHVSATRCHCLRTAPESRIGSLAIGGTRRAFLEGILVSLFSSRLGVAPSEFAVSGGPAKCVDVVANHFGFFGHGGRFGSTFAFEID